MEDDVRARDLLEQRRGQFLGALGEMGVGHQQQAHRLSVLPQCPRDLGGEGSEAPYGPRGTIQKIYR
ncbi:hypothetical protein GCM10010508_24390 [Streptomyces naganishii JCM 4654]|uniref:Uncharacterized protein n=1 Tax=Streptomyces naganishii JCM 4654 TaxID=1306179 RepID=A0A918Y258_9ACTN|nr:hypothetical protein GCM10010508_24390 [Streptomyces naganishii JCM 4654]